MRPRTLEIRLPDLDGARALQLIGLLDAIVGELWVQYGDVIFGFADQESDDVDPDEASDLPF